MTPNLFPLIVALMEAGARIVCLCQRQWLMAIVWAGYTAASVALAFVKG